MAPKTFQKPFWKVKVKQTKWDFGLFCKLLKEFNSIFHLEKYTKTLFSIVNFQEKIFFCETFETILLKIFFLLYIEFLTLTHCTFLSSLLFLSLAVKGLLGNYYFYILFNVLCRNRFELEIYINLIIFLHS